MSRFRVAKVPDLADFWGMPNSADEHPTRSQRVLRGIRHAFLTGLIGLFPLGVTVIVLNFLLATIGGPASNLLFGWLTDFPDKGVARFFINAGSTLIVLVLVTVIGYFSNYVFGRFAAGMAERLINRVPFVNSVYKTAKQIIDTFGKQNKSAFQKVVLVEFPRPGVWAVGFLTSTTQGEASTAVGGTLHNVFVPTTPNPTSGFLLLVPADQIKELHMSVADGMKLIISGGAVVPAYVPAPMDRQQVIGTLAGAAPAQVPEQKA